MIFDLGPTATTQAVNLLPGPYMTQISEVNGATGVALAEVSERPIPTSTLWRPAEV